MPSKKKAVSRGGSKVRAGRPVRARAPKKTVSKAKKTVTRGPRRAAVDEDSNDLLLIPPDELIERPDPPETAGRAEVAVVGQTTTDVSSTEQPQINLDDTPLK